MCMRLKSLRACWAYTSQIYINREGKIKKKLKVFWVPKSPTCVDIGLITQKLGGKFSRLSTFIMCEHLGDMPNRNILSILMECNVQPNARHWLYLQPIHLQLSLFVYLHFSFFSFCHEKKYNFTTSQVLYSGEFSVYTKNSHSTWIRRIETECTSAISSVLPRIFADVKSLLFGGCEFLWV